MTGCVPAVLDRDDTRSCDQRFDGLERPIDNAAAFRQLIQRGISDVEQRLP